MNIHFEYFFTAKDIAAENIDILSSIDNLYFPIPWKASDWNKIFVNSSRLLVVARSTESIIGFALFDINVVDSFAHLLKIIVIPDIQNKGVGGRLLKSSLEFLMTNQKINKYFLEVEVGNIRAISLYKKCGLEIIHTKKDFYGSSKDAFIMTMNLTIAN